MKAAGELQDSPRNPLRPWRHTVEILFRIGGILVLAFNAIVGIVLWWPATAPDAPALLGAGLVLFCQVLMVLDLWKSGSAWVSHAVLLLAVVGLALVAGSADAPSDATSVWWPMQFLMSAVIYAAMSTRGPARWFALGGLLGAHLALRMWGWQLAGLDFDGRFAHLYTAELALLVVTGGTIVLGLKAVGGAADSTDALLEVERRRREEAARDRADVFRSHEADRFIHDTVLHTLRMIAMDRRAIPAATARDAAARLAGILADPLPGARSAEARPAQRLRDRLQSLADSPERADLDVRVSGATGAAVPPDVEVAIVRATKEALDNIALHGATDQAHVLVAMHGLRVTVTITDHGRGFELERVTGGRGVKESIVQRMADAGGKASVTSEPGRGTIVRLEWEPERPADATAHAGTAAFGAASGVFPAILIAAMPLVVFNVWNAAWRTQELAWPMGGWLASLLVAILFAFYGWRGLKSGISRSESRILTFGAWAASLINGLAATIDGGGRHTYWMAGSAAVLAVIQVMFRPLRESIVTCVGLIVIAGTLVGLRTETGAGFPPSHIGPVLAPVFSLIVCWAGRRLFDAMARSAMLAHESALRSFDAAMLRAVEREALEARVEHRDRKSVV